jgi:hypothetical protein
MGDKELEGSLRIPFLLAYVPEHIAIQSAPNSETPDFSQIYRIVLLILIRNMELPGAISMIESQHCEIPTLLNIFSRMAGSVDPVLSTG